MKLNFHQLFIVSDGMISPKIPLQMEGVTMNPGVSFGQGLNMGGVNLSQHIGKDFEVEIKNGIHVIKGLHG